MIGGGAGRANPQGRAENLPNNQIGHHYTALQPLASGVLSKLTAGIEAALQTHSLHGEPPMFEAMLYIVAVVAILGFFGDRHTTTEPATVTPAPAADAASEPTTPADGPGGGPC